ncbi:branched-chain amino acid ABC transporter permease [Halomonas sp. M5N1S17]|uniref:branched-chain amino acid ABC transporter permease n=1 Tax=Halomonas alkalisoli TaxID=2907158 RepID=UPI001F1944AF|nr:branched-chain amino acid ABC transporter permease [Halomonas alkalisoli]MCE9664967.1 branched-chain amino acid ABC transporter permease [Halomonas alkalisoli]
MSQVIFLKGLMLGVALAFILPILLPPGRRWRVPGGIVLGLGLGLGIAALVPSGYLSYFIGFMTMASIYAILSLGLNTQWGYTGHLNFGVAGFFAVGAFTSALFTIEAPTGLAAQYTQVLFGLKMPFVVGVMAAAVVSGAVAFLVAVPVLRLRLDFLAIATIGVAEIIRLIFQNERWLANGPQPLRGIPQPGRCLFETRHCEWVPDSLAWIIEPLSTRDYTAFYLMIVAGCLALVYVVLERACRSPWGRMLRAVRDEETSAAMSGKNVPFARVQAFVVGAVIMGIAGALYAHYTVAIDYSHFHALFATFLVWIMLMLGGSGNHRGAIVGAILVWGVWAGTAFLANALEPLLAAIHQDLPGRAQYIRWLLVSLLLAAVVLFRPKGLLPEEMRVSRYVPDPKRR